MLDAAEHESGANKTAMHRHGTGAEEKENTDNMANVCAEANTVNKVVQPKRTDSSQADECALAIFDDVFGDVESTPRASLCDATPHNAMPYDGMVRESDKAAGGVLDGSDGCVFEVSNTAGTNPRQVLRQPIMSLQPDVKRTAATASRAKASGNNIEHSMCGDSARSTHCDNACDTHSNAQWDMATQGEDTQGEWIERRKKTHSTAAWLKTRSSESATPSAVAAGMINQSNKNTSGSMGKSSRSSAAVRGPKLHASPNNGGLMCILRCVCLLYLDMYVCVQTWASRVVRLQEGSPNPA